MARADVLHHALNVGVFDEDKLHRVDVERLRLAAERQTNILPDSIGRGSARPGTSYVANIGGFFRPIEFVSANDEAVVLCLSNGALQVCNCTNDTMITRPAGVTTAITNGDFSAGAGWTLSAAAGQSTTISGGKLNLQARAHGAKALASQTVAIAGANNIAVEHGVRVVVDRGPITLKIGSTSGGDEYIELTVLRKGTHSLGITPTAGNIYIEIASEDPNLKIVDSITIEAAGVMSVPTNWPTAALGSIRPTQSLDVLFLACAGYKEQRIERRNSGRSWSVCDYDREDGPFQVGRSGLVTLAPGALEGNTTLTASAAFFKAAHVGALFRLFHEGQAIDTYLAGQNQFTDAINITGITETNFEERLYTYTIAGTWAGTIRNRRAYDGEFGAYHDFRRAQTVATIDITANASYTNDDNDDNIDEWVRIGFPAGGYTSGEAHITASYPNGGGFGICRVVSYNSPTSVNIEILVPFKGTSAVVDWRQSRYDGVSGYPSAVAFDDGRLTWSGNDLFDASVSDAYESFDENVVGDSGPLSRSLALGGRNDVRWAIPLSSLMIGCDSRIANVRASSLDEILTPSNFGVKSAGRIGAAAISPVELADDRAVFVQASGVDLFEITWSADKSRYVVSPFNKLTRNLFATGISELAVQVLPDQRLWVANMNADAVCIIFEPTQQVLAAHIPISTSTDTDFFEGFAVAPGDSQDRVYAAVRRVVNGSTRYNLEKFAPDSEAKVGDVCKIMDSHVAGVGVHSATITGLGHLEAREVVAWVDGAPVIDETITTPGEDNTKYFTVVAGQITLPDAPQLGYCVGLPYDFEYKSARLAYGIEGYTPMLRKKSIAGVGLLLADYVRDGIKFGTTTKKGEFETPWSLPDISTATGTTAENIVAGTTDDEESFPVGSQITPDTRLCISGHSPKPFSILSIVLALSL